MFSKRINSPELLDRPDMDETFAIQSYHFMSVVNKYFGGTAIVKRFIKCEIHKRHKPEPLRILDIGSGVCDIPVSISKWANKAGVKVEFTCVETNPYAVKLAQANISDYANIKLIQENIFNFQPVQKYDCASGSLFFHHLSDQEILILINKIHGLGCQSILINDLHRSFLCYAGCLLASLFISADVRHDALLSIRKGFQPKQLCELLKPLHHTNSIVRTAWFGRVYAIITEDNR